MAESPLSARLEIFRQRLVAVPERMGETLARTALSANIKERRDHSCALFDAAGRLLAQAAHIPVHLGSMGESVAAVRRAFPEMAEGDDFLLNDPYEGGTHLPDITLIMPIHAPARSGDMNGAPPPSAALLSAAPTGHAEAGRLVGFAVTRAHHADVGGASPGSMAVARSIHEEGVRIPPARWYARGVEQLDLTRLILANVRTPQERLGDLHAQRAAAEIGRQGLLALRARYEEAELERLQESLLDYAERRMRAVIAALPEGDYAASDLLEGDGFSDAPIPIRVTLRIRGDKVTVDFAGTSQAVAGCVNCPASVCRAAAAYVFACLAGDGLPHNEGMHRPIHIATPEGSLINARYPAAVAAGNVETSQRLVDVLLGALAAAAPDRIPAASAGTMNSLTLGGVDRRTGRSFAYYETIGGGSGAAKGCSGESGVQTHMTNTRNTPIEALEMEFPMRVRRYAIARGTGGGGEWRGGDGLVREITALVPMSGALLADRHRTGPAGRRDGLSGEPGRAAILHADGRVTAVGCKSRFTLSAGDTIQIVTPGGGGWGAVQIA